MVSKNFFYLGAWITKSPVALGNAHIRRAKPNCTFRLLLSEVAFEYFIQQQLFSNVHFAVSCQLWSTASDYSKMRSNWSAGATWTSSVGWSHNYKQGFLHLVTEKKVLQSAGKLFFNELTDQKFEFFASDGIWNAENVIDNEEADENPGISDSTVNSKYRAESKIKTEIFCFSQSCKVLDIRSRFWSHSSHKRKNLGPGSGIPRYALRYNNRRYLKWHLSSRRLQKRRFVSSRAAWWHQLHRS